MTEQKTNNCKDCIFYAFSDVDGHICVYWFDRPIDTLEWCLEGIKQNHAT